MISYAEALRIIATLKTECPQENLPLEEALGRVLAANVYAPLPHPFFSNSAMDGYAYRADAVDTRRPLRLVGEIFAGDAPLTQAVDPTQACVKIMTGAALPEWADTVVPVEKTSRGEDGAVLIESAVAPRENVRWKGEDIPQGLPLLEKGRRLTPEHLGVCAAFGMPSVPVEGHSKVAVFTTGEELRLAGDTLKPGQIYDSNGTYLCASFRSIDLPVQGSMRLPDAEEALQREAFTFFEASEGPALLVTSGAVSAGERDFVPSVARDAGFEPLFHKVAVRPGKPFFLARRDHHLWCGIPGNPVSTMTAWHYFLRPILASWTNIPTLRKELVTLSHDVSKPEKFHCFYRAIVENSRAQIPPQQGSAQLRASLSTNAYVELPEGLATLRAGTEVEAIRIK